MKLMFSLPIIISMPSQSMAADDLVPTDVLQRIEQYIDKDSADSFSRFYNNLYNSIIKKDILSICNAIHYPIVIYNNKKTIILRNRSEACKFLNNEKNYNNIKRLTKDPKDLEVSSKGVMWGQGEIWFIPFQRKNGVLWAIARISNIN